MTRRRSTLSAPHSQRMPSFSTCTRTRTTTGRCSRSSATSIVARRGVAGGDRLRARANRPARSPRGTPTDWGGRRRPRSSPRSRRTASARRIARSALADRDRVRARLAGLPLRRVLPGRGPAFYRRGGLVELQRRIDAGEVSPDFGPGTLDDRAGGVIVGARNPLIAFNVNLATDDAEVARSIAAVVREAGGGFPGVRALGLALPRAGRAQVSMNVEDWEAAALHATSSSGSRPRPMRAASTLSEPSSSGSCPPGRLRLRPGAILRIDGFNSSHVLELRLLERAAPESAWPGARLAHDGSGDAIRLTGDDLRSVTSGRSLVERRRGRALPTRRATKMRAARELVERAAHGSARAHLRHQHRLRPFRLAVDPGGADRRAPAPPACAVTPCGVGEPVSRRDRPRGDAAARERAREGQLRGAGRDRRAAARVPRPRRPSVRAEPWIGRRAAATSRRSRTSRCRSSARGRRGSTGERSAGADALAARRARADPARGEGGAVAHQRHAVHGGATARSALVRARRLARAADIACALSLEALQGSRTSFLPQIHALRPLRGQSRLGGERPAPARGLGDQRGAHAGATRCRTRTRCAARRRCTAPRATCSTTSKYTVAVELNAATDNPLVLVDDELLVSNGNFHGQPLAFALDALAMAGAELANISERRVERLVNPNLSDGLPAFLTHGRRPELRLHDPAVRRRLARQREQGRSAIPPASTRSRRAPGRRITSRWGTPPALKAWQVLANSERALAIELLAGRRRSSSSRRSSPDAACALRTRFVRSLSPRLR